jgi:hypothetical protein
MNKTLPAISLSIMLLLTLVSGAQSRPPLQTPYTYTAFDGQQYTLYPYIGRRVALLTPSAEINDSTLRQVVDTLDRAFDYYVQVTGRAPSAGLTYNNLLPIAVVASTCGAGCAQMGMTGIEITQESFDKLYEGVKNTGRYDQVLFYELGRNFWFYSEQLNYKESYNDGVIDTGFAVFMRYAAMQAAGATPNDDVLRDKTVTQDLINVYLANAAYTWDNTLQSNEAPTNELGLDGADLFASFLFALQKTYGEQFTIRLWQQIPKLSVADSTQAALDNFFIAASIAANTNLGSQFDIWRLPISDAARLQVQNPQNKTCTIQGRTYQAGELFCDPDSQQWQCQSSGITVSTGKSGSTVCPRTKSCIYTGVYYQPGENICNAAGEQWYCHTDGIYTFTGNIGIDFCPNAQVYCIYKGTTYTPGDYICNDAQQQWLCLNNGSYEFTGQTGDEVCPQLLQ